MRFVIPIILLVLSAGLFFGYIDPTYDKVEDLRAEVAELDDALDRARDLIELRDSLLTSYNSFSTEDLERLRKLLPDHIDAVRLIIDIDGLVAQRGLVAEGITVQEGASDGRSPDQIGLASDAVGVVGVKFSVTTSYETLKQLLMDLEDSLRLLDVQSLSFSANDDDESSYSIDIRTYWLK